MLLSLLITPVLFALVSFGLAWPCVARLDLPPADKLLASVALSLLGVFLFGGLIYLAAWPNTLALLLPLLALTGVAVRRDEFRQLCSDAAVRQLAIGQLLVAAGAVFWLATIENYSGGGWAGDWYEHWERTRFFLEHWPLDTKFIAQYHLTARPPLANIVTAVFLAMTTADFAHYQLVGTLAASAAFLPAALLAHRWGGNRAIPVLVVLLLVNPLFMQNATFAWTKLPAAFFVLAGVAFFLRAREDESDVSAALLCATNLAAGLLSHYSAGPYVVALALPWLAGGRRGYDRGWWKRTLLMVAAGAAILSTWFGWSLAVYGVRGTFLTNSSVTSPDAIQGNQWSKIALNINDTLIPHFLRTLNPSLIAQRSPWGYLRDWWFQNYQVNLWFAFGSIAAAAIVYQAVRLARERRPGWVLWLNFVVLVAGLGIAVHGQRDHWGLAHICLQPLVIIGLAFLAARWTALGRGWHIALVAGATADFILGILLHFGIQSYALDRWLTPGRPPSDFVTSYNEAALLNLYGKIEHRLAFLTDTLHAPFALWLAAALAVLLLALLRAGSLPNDQKANARPRPDPCLRA
jgi:hypothetical protein